MKHSKLLLVGPYPPPYGGVSVHIKRLCHRLGLEGIASTVTCQPGIHLNKDDRCNIVSAKIGFNWQSWLMQFYQLAKKHRIIHFHTGWEHVPAAYFLSKHNLNIVFTFHDQNTACKMHTSDCITRWCLMRMFAKSECRFVAVSENIMNQLIDIGAKKEMISVIPAYLFPSINTNQSPKYLLNFVEKHTPVLSIYGWKTSFDEQGQDIYGFDYTLSAIAELKRSTPKVGLIILIPSGDNVHYINVLKLQAAKLGISSNILFITNPYKDAYTIWKMSDIFLRPTTTDGDAVSVREALNVGTPVIASNVAFRPEGVRLIDRSSVDNLVDAIIKHMKSNNRSSPALHIPEDFFIPLCKLYRELGV